MFCSALFTISAEDGKDIHGFNCSALFTFGSALFTIMHFLLFVVHCLLFVVHCLPFKQRMAKIFMDLIVVHCLP